MEQYKTIDQYIASEMGGKIAKRSQSPLLGLLILAVGVGLLVLLHGSTKESPLEVLCLTVGIGALAVGLVLTAMCLTGALSHYVYTATKSKMKMKRVYLSSDEYRRCVEALNGGDRSALAGLTPVVSANCLLQLCYSHDRAIALLQACTDTGHFTPETPVTVLVGSEVAAIEPLCK